LPIHLKAKSAAISLLARRLLAYLRRNGNGTGDHGAGWLGK
jgi:hypothetical protein